MDHRLLPSVEGKVPGHPEPGQGRGAPGAEGIGATNTNEDLKAADKRCHILSYNKTEILRIRRDEFRLEPTLLRQAISLETVFRSWDVLCPFSTSDLVRLIVQNQAGGKGLLAIVANFSDFLQRSGKFDKARPQLEELLRHCSGLKGTAFWIEPATNLATEEGGLLARVWAKLITPLLAFIVPGKETGKEGRCESELRFYFRALASDERIRTSVALLPTTLKGRE